LLYLFEDNLNLSSIILDSIPVSTPLGVVAAAQASWNSIL
jgi:hypothetical protein